MIYHYDYTVSRKITSVCIQKLTTSLHGHRLADIKIEVQVSQWHRGLCPNCKCEADWSHTSKGCWRGRLWREDRDMLLAGTKRSWWRLKTDSCKWRLPGQHGDTWGIHIPFNSASHLCWHSTGQRGNLSYASASLLFPVPGWSFNC